VIENLAINAVKYGTPSTPITLTLQQIVRLWDDFDVKFP
jgi:hypothetical protein